MNIYQVNDLLSKLAVKDKYTERQIEGLAELMANIEVGDIDWLATQLSTKFNGKIILERIHKHTMSILGIGKKQNNFRSENLCDKCKSGFVTVLDSSKLVDGYVAPVYYLLPKSLIPCKCSGKSGNIMDYLSKLSKKYIDNPEIYDLSILVLWSHVQELDINIDIEIFNPYSFFGSYAEFYKPDYRKYENLLNYTKPEPKPKKKIDNFKNYEQTFNKIPNFDEFEEIELEDAPF